MKVNSGLGGAVAPKWSLKTLYKSCDGFLSKLAPVTLSVDIVIVWNNINMFHVNLSLFSILHNLQYLNCFNVKD